MDDPNGDVIQSALAIRAARAIDDHLREVATVKRMQLENQIEEILEFQRQYVAQREDSQAEHAALIESVTEALRRLITIAENPPVPPDTRVTLDQQPVTVNVPPLTVNVPLPEAKPAVTFSPVVTIPESQVVIDRPNAPTRATIKHSDGTRSEIIFDTNE